MMQNDESSGEEYREIFEGLDFENKKLRGDNLNLSNALSVQGFGDEEQQNLIYYKLETDKILERIERFLKGDELKFTKDGVYYTEPKKKVLCAVKRDHKTKTDYYIQELKQTDKKGVVFMKRILIKIVNASGEEIEVHPKDSAFIMEKLDKMETGNLGFKYITVIDEDKKPFNEYGVAELMRIISQYVTKETFLSHYEEERIYEILGDLGDALNNFLYCNYEQMGMDTKFKESKYTLIILNILHTIESCYRRALGGNEQKHMETKSIVTQNSGGNSVVGQPISKKKWNPIKPSTW